MPKKPLTKGGAQPMKQMLVTIPVDLHRRLKIEVAERGITVKTFVTEAIAEALKKGGGKK